jgi:LPS-assembly protein
MLFRKILVSIILATTLFSAEQKVEIIAKNVDAKDEVTTATGSVVIIGKGYYIRADKVIYDKKNEIIEAFGNVYALKDSSSYIISDYAKIDINDKSGSFDKFFMQSQTDDIWVSSKTANIGKRFYDVNNSSIISSCDVSNPEWQIKYDKGEYDSQEKTMTLKSATFYAGSWPLLYTPYISFSTDKTRKSGLLQPDFGYKADEGFLFAQPIYFVSSPDANWDSQTTPQIRTTRGKGIFENLRFIDSPYSQGSLMLGYFRDEKSFTEKQSLKYASHYGYSFMYNRSKLFSNNDVGVQDGLYTDLNWLNDIDYKNLQDLNNNGLKLNVEAIATSKINYFYQKDKDYFGSYFRYYFDTSKTSNDDTLQQLPKLQYHRSLDSIFVDNLLYSGDIKVIRYDRKTGLTANQYQGAIPLMLNFSILDGFAGLTFGENFYINKATFGNDNTATNYSNYSYMSNNHNVKLYTDLIKPYDNFVHAIEIEGSYTKPGLSSEKNYPSTLPSQSDRTLYAKYVATPPGDILSQVTTPIQSAQDLYENASFKLVQFFNNKQGDNIISHRLNQIIYFDASRVGYRYADIENEIRAKVNDKITLDTDVFYSYSRSEVSKLTSSLKYSQDKDYSFNLSQTYKAFNDDSGDKSNYLSFGFDKSFAYKYHIFGNYDYDYALREERSWGLGIGMKKRCFSYQISVKRENTPILTSTSASSVRNFVLYLSVNFIPIGGINQSYSVK